MQFNFQSSHFQLLKNPWCYGMINRMIILRPLNRFPTGKLSITFSNQKEYCKGNRKPSVKDAEAT